MKITDILNSFPGMKCFFSFIFCLVAFGSSQAATSPFTEAEASLNAAEKQFEQAKAAENQATTSGEKQGSAQKSGRIPWSSAEKSGQNVQAPETAEEARRQALQGSPETGYAGTWTDPQTGDIITSVIAPTPPAQNNTGSYPIIVEPNVGNWGGYSDYDAGWSGTYPNWPVTPDNPGYGGLWNGPPPKPFAPPAWSGPTYYPYPHPPANFHPGYRPLRPGQGGNQGWGGNWQPGPFPPGNNGQPGAFPGGNWQPGNPPSGNWQPGNPPVGNWQPGSPPQGGNGQPAPFPGGNWQPGNPSSGNWQPGIPPQGNWQPGPGPQGAWRPGNRPFWPGTPGNLGSLWHPGLDRPALPGGVSGIGWNPGFHWAAHGHRPARPWR